MQNITLNVGAMLSSSMQNIIIWLEDQLDRAIQKRDELSIEIETLQNQIHHYLADKHSARVQVSRVLE